MDPIRKKGDPRPRRERGSSNRETPTRRRPGRNQVILLIDDDVAFRRDLSEGLEAAGFAAIAAADGSDAMRVLSQSRTRPTAIVLDLLMPEVDGLAFLRWFDQQPQLRRIPVIIASGNVEARRSELEHRRWILEKPFSVEEIVDVIEAAAAAA